MESGCWQKLIYAIVYSTNLSGLQLARSQFHRSVCPHVAGGCLCERRVCWALVSALPKGAVVEWQFATFSGSSEPTNQRSVFLDPVDEIEGCTMLLINVGDDETPSLVQCDFSVVVPVLGFLQPNATRVAVKMA